MSVFGQVRFDVFGDHTKGTLTRATARDALQTTVIAGVESTYKAGTFVKATGEAKEGRMVVEPITAATDEAVGVIPYNFVGGDQELVLEADKLIEVLELNTFEEILVEAGGAIVANQAVEVTADGEKVVASNGTNKVVGRARDVASADGDLIRISLRA